MDISYDELRIENEQLRTELNQHRLRLAELSHKEYQVPDGSIRDELQKICRAIDSWIAYASEGQAEYVKKQFQSAIDNEGKEDKLFSLGLEPQGRATSDPKLKSFKSLEELPDFILPLAIGKYIFGHILARGYMVGMTDSQCNMLESVEEEMYKAGKGLIANHTLLQAYTDRVMVSAKSKVCQWRSDTLKAFCVSEHFTREHKDDLYHCRRDLEAELTYWIGGDQFKKHEDRLKGQIFEPAVKLHLDMKCSSRQYEVIWRPDIPTSDDGASQRSFPSWELKDINSRRPITSIGPDHGLHCLYPGLVGIDSESEEILELVKPVMVVYRKPPLAQSKRSLLPSASSSPGPIDSSAVPRKDSSAKHHKALKDNSSTTKPGFLDGVRNILQGTSRKQVENKQSPKRVDGGSSASRRPPQDPGMTSRDSKKKSFSQSHPDEELDTANAHSRHPRSAFCRPPSPLYAQPQPHVQSHYPASVHVIAREPCEIAPWEYHNFQAGDRRSHHQTQMDHDPTQMTDTPSPTQEYGRGYDDPDRILE